MGGSADRKPLPLLRPYPSLISKMLLPSHIHAYQHNLRSSKAWQVWMNEGMASLNSSMGHEFGGQLPQGKLLVSSGDSSRI